MSKLEYFLHPVEEVEIKEIVISERFKGADGKPATIKIKAITQDENNSLIKRCSIREKGANGLINETVDRQKYICELILSCCVEPNFREPEFVTKMGVANPADALTKIFLPGEFSKLSEEVLKIIGMGDILEQAKNL